jgi:prolyl oligopeptidase
MGAEFRRFLDQGRKSGFFYSRYDEPAKADEFKGPFYYHKMYFHRLGTEQSQDRLIYERKDQKEWGFHGSVTV